MALTGVDRAGDAAVVADAQLDWLISEYFPVKAEVQAATWTDRPTSDWNGPTDDEELIKKMCSSKSAASAFGGKASFSDLWDGKTDFHGGDNSSADAALCQHLAFWTGKDCTRVDRLFRLSGLMRDKWDRKTAGSTYGAITILKAIGLCNKVFGQGVAPVIESGQLREGFQLLSVDQQVEYFKGCTYVGHLNKILTPIGTLLDSARFKATYGGYIFVLGNSHDSKTTPDAWKAFTENQGFNFPKVNYTCFRPDVEPGAVVIDDIGHTEVNTYIPSIVESTQGDASPFLNHLILLLPDENDRLILLAYLAAVVQHIGVKFQWCPLIQGAQGNGKSLLTRCLARAVGERYTHTPNASDIANKFNAWIDGKVLIIIEEIAVAGKWETMDVLKTMITQDMLEIQGKGQDQRTARICANFVMNSNRKDSLVKTKGDRRHAIFFTAQQEPEDLLRDGMGGDYFPNIYKWLRAGGYGVVTHYLQNYAIPDELNPAKDCHRAPHTSSTAEAIMESLTIREQEVLNAISEGVDGFRGGWISSVRLTELLRLKNLKVPPNRVKSMMATLGYVHHPGLKNGRVDDPIITEGNKKPRLYVQKGHMNLNFKGGKTIVDAYIKAQASTPTMASQAFMEVNP